ncbi:ABC transporter permease [Corynebacterium halotolerans]|uniref:ABC transporter permease n=1 Tax=Corynebacterium halotolerans TaxID=225326 RepID=UPI003CEDB73C
MFLGLRDLVHAKGRFSLIGAVVGLITLLLVMLTGLTGGLGQQNTSALEALDPDRFVFAATTPGEEAEVSFTDSQITTGLVEQWRDLDGIDTVVPLGATQTRLEATGASSVAVLGMPAGAELPGGGTLGEGLVLSESVAEEQNIATGDTVTLGGQEVEVTGTTADEYYSHSPVVWTDTGTWTEVAHVGDRVVGTALLVDGSLDKEAWATAAAATDTTATDTSGAFAGLPAYSSEQGSLVTMQGFLYAISALVTVSFLTVWTIQRTRDLSILRALGASGRYLLRDALGQSAVILALGTTLGALLGWGLGTLAGQAVPFELSVLNVAGPAIGIWLLGMLGAFFATRKVSQVDPMIALGGNA